LTSRPVINLQQNPDTAKMVDIERIRREAFGHIGRLTDAVERQRDEMDEQQRMVATPRIRRYQEPTEEEIIDESVDVEGIDEGSAIPSVNEAEMDRLGANDATEEMQNDRLVGYAGEDDEGFVANSDDDNGFVDPGEPEIGDESASANIADEQQDWFDNASQEDEQAAEEEIPVEEAPSAQAQEPEPETRIRAGRGASKYDTKAISTALTSLGLTEIAKNKAEINNLKMFQVSQIFDVLKENGITRSGYEGMNAKDRKDLLAEELSKYGEMLLRKKND
jgi:hypothetical protein